MARKRLSKTKIWSFVACKIVASLERKWNSASPQTALSSFAILTISRAATPLWSFPLPPYRGRTKQPFHLTHVNINWTIIHVLFMIIRVWETKTSMSTNLSSIFVFVRQLVSRYLPTRICILPFDLSTFRMPEKYNIPVLCGLFTAKYTQKRGLNGTITPFFCRKIEKKVWRLTEIVYICPR